MTGDLEDVPLFTPWRAVSVYCIFCCSDWTAAVPYDIHLLECPRCLRITPLRPVPHA